MVLTCQEEGQWTKWVKDFKYGASKEQEEQKTTWKDHVCGER